MDFGTETDIRDCNGDLVISHDIPNGRVLRVKDFFEIHSQFDVSLPLALNIKADGLQSSLKKLLQEYNISNYFVFDMSIPDMIIYLKEGFNVFTRQSEYETKPAFYENVEGIWMDCFNKEWRNTEDIQNHFDKGKKVCLVSPELHARNYQSFWQRLLNTKLVENNCLMICTDYPQKAREFFYGKD